jgi:hypothetical protein
MSLVRKNRGDRWNDGMQQFVVRATEMSITSWLSVRNANGIRTLGPRWMAAVFETDAEARMAMGKFAKTPAALGMFDISFTVERRN